MQSATGVQSPVVECITQQCIECTGYFLQKNHLPTCCTTTYKATVTAPKRSTVVVLPEKLVFEKKYEKQSYTLTIKYTKDDEANVSFGALVWIEESGKFTVRSPIAVSPFLTSV
ncbi:hypothetical protein Q3G72_030944 [Acer saccharum]|nr:hypothetical protein Q3G72_030944 [Acer saccharum]